MAQMFQPPHRPFLSSDNFKVFLGGSIDMGAAVDWQKQFVDMFRDMHNVVLLNPRREDWNPDWVQDISNPDFNEQVNWELAHLELCDLAIFYFSPTGPAPVTLMELGLMASSGKCLVACPPGYWRRGNVQIVCHRNNIPLFDSLEELISAARQRVFSGK